MLNTLAIGLAILGLWLRISHIFPSSVLTNHLWHFISYFSPSPEIRKLRETRKELLDIRNKRAAVSSKDEFAKWARLDRQHSKLKQEIDKINVEVLKLKAGVGKFVSFLRFCLTTGIRFYVLYNYSGRAVFWLPPNAIPGVLEWWLALPKAPKGSISASVWLMICDQSFNAFWQGAKIMWLVVKELRASQRTKPVSAKEKAD